MATIKDVSKLAGVSVATVSRVINKKGYVSKETEKKILKAMKLLKYSPNDIARRLAGKKSKTIGLIIPNILNPFFPEVARGVEDIANQHGYNLIFCNTDNNKEKEKQYYEMLFNKQVDGIIIFSYTATSEELLELMDRGMPLVALDRAFIGYKIPSISGNNKKGGSDIARYLIDLGCKKIAYISGPMFIEPLYDRFNGFKNVLTQENLFRADLVKIDELSLKGGYNATKEIFNNEKNIDAIVACNDILAIGSYKALVRMGYNIGKDIKLIGYDGLESNINYLEISSMAQPMYEYGEKALKLLLRQIEKNEDISKEKIKLDAKLIKRMSTIGVYQEELSK